MTSEQELSNTFFAEDMRVLEVTCATGSSGKHHISWSGTYGGFPDDKQSNEIIVIATLHAGGATGYATVTVGALLTPVSKSVKISSRGLSKQIRDSTALEGLYDFARVAIRSAAALVDARLKIPAKSPEAELSPYNEDEAEFTPTRGELSS